ncbi:MAG TPA: hypothetical protein VFN03_02995, partial [Trueperaceae bacterium]|nr:hypothetical protein [Trueperaceae bacterium]
MDVLAPRRHGDDGPRSVAGPWPVVGWSLAGRWPVAGCEAAGGDAGHGLATGDGDRLRYARGVFHGPEENSVGVPGVRRLLLALLLATVVSLAATAFAQREPFQQMSGLLDQGYYNSAARLNGPELIARFPDDPEAHYLYAL